MLFYQFEEVSILNEAGIYRVLRSEGKFIWLEDEHGFERKIAQEFVVRRQQISLTHIYQKDQTSSNIPKKKPITELIPSIDLHHHELNLDERFLSKHAILSAQLDAFKLFCNSMIQSKIKRFRVVHGIGEGRLKSEIRDLVHGKEGISMHDDQVTRGKVGASLIELHMSSVRKF